MTSFSDDFNRADGPVGANWVAVTGTWSVLSNQLSPGSAGGTIILRAATAMATNDHYVQITITATTAASHGVWCRGDSTLTQGYLLRNDGSNWTLFYVVGGSFVSIGNYAAAAAVGDVVKLQAVGSAITVTIDGVERIHVTDTVVPTGTSVGVRSESTSLIRFDDFVAADVTEGATLPVAGSVEAAQTLTGVKAATLSIAAEVDGAQTLPGTKTTTLTVAGEADAAQPVAGTKSAVLAVAGEQDVGQGLTGGKVAVLGAAGSTEGAQPLTGAKAATLTPAVEVDAAQALTAVETESGTITTAGAVETAMPLVGVKTAVLPTAVEVDTARPLFVPSSVVSSAERTYRIPAGRRRFTVAAERRILIVRR